jgi:metallo-beta-lactamase family protein
MHPVRARIERIDAFSAHADRDGLLRWLEGLRPRPRRVFLVHGEEEAARSFSEVLSERDGWDVEIPEYGESFEIA